ncbi:branched-chain amino acid aminotransferase [Pseudohongiella spirulinae]|uniref:Branched-chain-amino-acid aminotransferase n=1 Tax=Pseudohongiella spirulinae TaxID=1249552 RepID=A0A0S2KEV9_9GAMM|nr:branched-chain amino acid aminotransferase [Pseudohongiella spirulinae]ALO46482.1 Branched-chain-amino-acid aminotransferase [Pseudohongiella spirulinae]
MTQQFTTPKKDLNWAELGFQYRPTEFRFRALHRNGQWSDGELITDNMISVHEGAPALHYAQQCFEGLKAQTAPDGRVLLFRPELNAERMRQAAERLLMPQVPEALFIRGVEEAVRANYAWIPPHGSGAALYIRPMLIGVGENLGLKTAKEFEFRVFVSPVGPYYKSAGLAVISLAVSDLDRAAPAGTGNYKIGANYAGGLLATRLAQELGANEALFLDARERRYIDEAGSANIVVAMRDGSFVTPGSNAVLPSVTRRSIMTLAEQELGMKIEQRAIDLRKEIDQFEEVAACGTAAVISPVGKIYIDGQWHSFYGEGEQAGPVMQKLYNLLVGIQRGELEDKFGWTHEVKA